MGAKQTPTQSHGITIHHGDVVLLVVDGKAQHVS
jgi:hypothetical protein